MHKLLSKVVQDFQKNLVFLTSIWKFAFVLSVDFEFSLLLMGLTDVRFSWS